MEAELAQSNSIDSPRESLISPATVEGSALYWNLMRAQIAGKSIAVEPGAGERWRVSVPLNPGETTNMELGFENDGLVANHQISWVPTDLTTSGPLTIRQGDSLLFTVESGRGEATPASVALEEQRYQLGSGETVAHQFNNPGEVVVQVLTGSGQSRVVTVNVVAVVEVDPIAALSGSWREWSPPPDLPALVFIDPDPMVELGALSTPDGSRRFRLRTNDPMTRYLNLRLGEGGPILQQIPVHGFRFDYGKRTGLARVTRYFSDFSRLVKADAVMTPVRQTVTSRGRVSAGGLLYSSGRIEETFAPTSFDELGMLTQEFLQTTLSKTSVCHQIDLFQGQEQLNEF